jgi:single-strand DNA-binding protein
MLRAHLIGNLGGDPELRYSASGSPFLRMNVAANYRARNPEGEWQDRTEWVRVTVTGQRAESLSQYLRKGSKVYAEGRLEARPWTDQQGQVRAGLELLADELQFMSARAGDEQRGGGGGGGGDTGGVPRGPSGSSGEPSRPAPQSRPEPVDEGGLEDLPF